MAPDKKRIAQALLETMSADAPSARSRESALAAFGVLSGVTAVTTGATAGALGSGAGTVSSLTMSGSIPTVSAAGAAPAATALVAGKLATSGIALSLTKAVFIGALAGGAAVYAGSQVPPPLPARPATETASNQAATNLTGDSPHGRTRGQTPSAAPAMAADVPPPPPQDEGQRDEGQQEDRPNAPRVPQAAAPRPSDFVAKNAPPPAVIVTAAPVVSPPAEAVRDDLPKLALADEIQRLDRARFALRAGAASQALQELAAYETAYPGGILLPEATVLHVEVLMQLGDEAGARALGSAFVSAHPTSGHVPKILRSLSKRAP